jgi:hypothetical protein
MDPITILAYLIGDLWPRIKDVAAFSQGKNPNECNH